MSTLYLGAKEPVAGRVKTRLGAAIGMQRAADLYAAFLADLGARFRQVPFEVAWYVSPRPWPGLAATRVLVQRGEDWADRQANLFRVAAGRGPVVLAATDTPHLRPARVAQAFRALETNELVLGPTYDGGYYLVGMRGFHDVLSGVAMSTEAALDQICSRARASDLRVELLAPDFDVDTEADLVALARVVARRSDLPATAAALAQLAAQETAA